jgi:hypothetical protein
MKLEVVWRCDREPQHARIENVDLDADDDQFQDAYVSISGYFGHYSPHIFTAAPDLYDALEEAAHPLSGYLYGPILDKAIAALAKARGE